MGIYDRDYVREDPPSGWLGGRSMVVNIVLLNCAIFVLNYMFGERSIDGRDWLTDHAGLHRSLWSHPWNFWQLLSYGFIHSWDDLKHVAFNMFGLWMFGRDVEGVYGRKEFVRIYLLFIVAAGLVWVVAETSVNEAVPMVGASGGVIGITMLWVLNFPQRMVYLFGVIPLRAWAFGALFILGDVIGQFDKLDNVAHVAHLGGAAVAFIYFKSGWNLGRWVPKGPKLKIHQPVAEDTRDLSKRVDEILEKISREGEASLSKDERRTLEEASRRYQRRKE